jgi:hypothetical protein
MTKSLWIAAIIPRLNWWAKAIEVVVRISQPRVEHDGDTTLITILLREVRVMLHASRVALSTREHTVDGAVGANLHDTNRRIYVRLKAVDALAKTVSIVAVEVLHYLLCDEWHRDPFLYRENADYPAAKHHI